MHGAQGQEDQDKPSVIYYTSMHMDVTKHYKLMCHH